MRLFSWFFGVPFLGPLEDLLFEKAKKHYIDGGGSLSEDAKTLKEKLKVQVEKWQAEENEKLKPVWKEFKRDIERHVATALSVALRPTDQSWYAVEMGDVVGYPDAIALPLLLLRRQTEFALRAVLAEKIQFKDMLPETRQALAAYAMARAFTSQRVQARKEYQPFQIGERQKRFVIADVIERDYYHLGSRETANRIDMVVLTPFSENVTDKDKKKHQHERDAIAKWQSHRDKRSDARRFTGEGWDLSENELCAMAQQ